MKLLRFLPTVLLAAVFASASSAQVDVSVTVAPPPLIEYEQPYCPVEGYIWTPGYWDYDYDAGAYYWVPGVWVPPPQVGYLWTPGYWAFTNGFYAFNTGYWGPRVGFYGGVNYGYGYGGNGYYGGRWDGGRFRYNTAVTRVNPSIVRYTYVDRSVVNRNVTRSRASYNGPGGVAVRPTSQQLAAARGPHVQATSQQLAERQTAKANPTRRVEAKPAKQGAALTRKPANTPAALQNANAANARKTERATAQREAAVQNANAAQARKTERATAQREAATSKVEKKKNVDRPANTTQHSNVKASGSGNNHRQVNTTQSRPVTKQSTAAPRKTTTQAPPQAHKVSAPKTQSQVNAAPKNAKPAKPAKSGQAEKKAAGKPDKQKPE